MTQLNLHKPILKKLILILILLTAILKVVFYKESLSSLFKVVFGLFWILILPGHTIMLYFREKVPFHLRLIIGTALAAVVIGAISYYLGLFGLNLKYHAYFLPIVIILIGSYIHYYHEQRRI